jgi:hypothetical protein
MPPPDDFIEIYDDALPRAACAALVARFEASGQDRPGEVGAGLMPDLKDSRDIRITGKPDWRDAEAQLNGAMFAGLLAYLRRYPYTLIAPLMLQRPADPAAGAGAAPRRLEAADIATLDDATLGDIVRTVLRPGPINLQRYRADTGGYPYWHCELYPKDASGETLHRHLLWTLYLNDGFEAGETEFVHQQRKVPPRTGSLLLAPSAFTHTHRGNRPVGGDKYIATSWVLFQRAEVLFGR